MLTIVATCILLYASYHLIVIFYDYYKNNQVMDDLQDLYYEKPEENTLLKKEVNEEKHIRSGFDTLLEKNDEVVGWITINDTKIDYPIVQAKDNEKYLARNFYNDYSRAGSIFMDYRNDITSESDKNYILYGHRTKDGSMFQHLTKYLEEDFFKEHQTFEFETLYGSYEAEVFAVYQTMTNFDYIRTDFSEAESFSKFINEVHEESLYNNDLDITEDDQIITLSTCDYKLDPDEGRLVVQAKLVKK